LGNLVFNKTARNFNEDMAAAAKITIAEVKTKKNHNLKGKLNF